mmetsp:Transcript_108965/g.243174  ORF Transcript_108965/g.243174 Transcript_108965/m.243174 type:complete len:214 (+) Transcript_108965:370-1011(+)
MEGAGAPAAPVSAERNAQDTPHRQGGVVTHPHGVRPSPTRRSRPVSSTLVALRRAGHRCLLATLSLCLGWLARCRGRTTVPLPCPAALRRQDLVALWTTAHPQHHSAGSPWRARSMPGSAGRRRRSPPRTRTPRHSDSGRAPTHRRQQLSPPRLDGRPTPAATWSSNSGRRAAVTVAQSVEPLARPELSLLPPSGEAAPAASAAGPRWRPRAG